MSARVLEIVGAGCSLGERQALDGVDLSVAAGELVALLGPNGAGKTTLLRACSGRIRLRTGTVRVAGRNPATDPVARRSLGIVPQSIALYPQLSAADNLSVFAQLSGLRGAARTAAVARALQRAGLQARAGDTVKNLSGGMQRRLNIVAGALHEPRLLLLDEPTVGVDPAARESIHALLETLRAAGMGLLLTTHDLDQAAELADRVAFMLAGRIVASGSLTELLARVFGPGQELLLLLAEPAADAGLGLLQSWGLQPLRGGCLWSGPLAGGVERLAELQAALAAAALRVVEISLREPGLSGVYRHLTGQEFAA
jgi:ABC-2 type transport system ATP-binding protein